MSGSPLRPGSRHGVCSPRELDFRALVNPRTATQTIAESRRKSLPKSISAPDSIARLCWLVGRIEHEVNADGSRLGRNTGPLVEKAPRRKYPGSEHQGPGCGEDASS